MEDNTFWIMDRKDALGMKQMIIDSLTISGKEHNYYVFAPLSGVKQISTLSGNTWEKTNVGRNALTHSRCLKG